MTKSVKFRVDDDSEMLEVWIDGECVNEGNFWDYDFVRDVPDLLSKLGLDVEVEDYEYDDGYSDDDINEEEDEQ